MPFFASPTLHTELENHGFKPVDSFVSPGRVPMTTYHHTMTFPVEGKPTTVHVMSSEFHDDPGKYRVNYHVTQNGQPYRGGEFDASRHHKKVAPRGVGDPIGSILEHHNNTMNVLRNRTLLPMKKAPLSEMSPDYSHHTVGEGLRSEIRSGPNLDLPLHTMSGVDDALGRSVMEKADEDLRP